MISIVSQLERPSRIFKEELKKQTPAALTGILPSILQGLAFYLYEAWAAFLFTLQPTLLQR
jgi:hypothetical protein